MSYIISYEDLLTEPSNINLCIILLFAFNLTLYDVTTVAIVDLDMRRLISITFLLNSGVVSSRKQATYPGMLSDSVVSNLDLVEDLCIWI